jgi:hypothetical protein
VARPVGSKSLWRQIVGRLLRTAPGKQEALLLDCGGNLKRLGNPLAPVKPPVERKEKAKPSCRACGYPKVPYLKRFEQNFNVINRIYKCAACGDEFEKESDLETVACESCDRYYLSTDVAIRDGKEILDCECGHPTMVKNLDDLTLVLADDALLQLKLKSFVDKASDESQMTEIMKASLIVMGAIESEIFDRDTILAMLEQSPLINVANVIQSKTATGSHVAQAKPPAHDNDRIKTLLADVNKRYRKSGRGSLSDNDIEVFMQGFESCQLPHKYQAVRTRLLNLESGHTPLRYILGFVSWIESHQAVH